MQVKIHMYLLISKALEQTIRGAFPVWEYDATDAFLWGIDLNAKIDFKLTRNQLKKISKYAVDIATAIIKNGKRSTPSLLFDRKRRISVL